MTKKRYEKIVWKKAPDIKRRVLHLVKTVDMDWIIISKLHFLRSENSKTRAYARIWGLSKVWQMTLGEKPTYIIEVISERFDKLDDREKDKILIHELAHIPQNFSGSLLPHIRKRGKRNFNNRVKDYFDHYLKHN